MATSISNDSYRLPPYMGIHIHLYKYHNTRSKPSFNSQFFKKKVLLKVTESKNALTEVVDRLNYPAPAFPSLEDFNTGWSGKT